MLPANWYPCFERYEIVHPHQCLHILMAQIFVKLICKFQKNLHQNLHSNWYILIYNSLLKWLTIQCARFLAFNTYKLDWASNSIMISWIILPSMQRSLAHFFPVVPFLLHESSTMHWTHFFRFLSHIFSLSLFSQSES